MARSCLIVGESEELLPESITVLLFPLLTQESYNLITALDELVAVPPDGIRRVGELDGFGVPV